MVFADCSNVVFLVELSQLKMQSVIKRILKFFINLIFLKKESCAKTNSTGFVGKIREISNVGF